MTSTAKLLRDLIALPSVNPSLAGADSARAGELRAAEFLAATAAGAGLDIEFREALPGRPNFLTRLSPRGKATRRILLAPHLDTVNAEDAQFSPRVKDGRLYGRGACDTKGSVAAMFEALRQLALNGPRPQTTEVVFAGLVDEEFSQAGSRALAGDGFKADLAVVGEPTELRVVTAHKGLLWIRLGTTGKCAHGSTPELGRNAIHRMARIVDWLETTYAARLRERAHPLLGCGTVNVGTIRGGQQANIVPDECSIMLDRRTIPGETDTGVLRELRRLLREGKLEAAEVENRSPACFPLETDARLPLVADLMGAAGCATPKGAQFFCDASVLAQGGIPSVVFGPGCISQAHTVDEWISLRSLEEATRILGRFLSALP